MGADSWFFLIPVTMIAGLWAYLIVRALSRSKIRELEIRERIALIEKGHVPAPEVDPRGFERAMKVRDRDYRGSYASRGAFRHRRAGTALVGVGLGLMVMIAFAGEAPGQAIGVGGFLVMIGLAFVVNGFIEHRAGPETLHETADPAGPLQAPKTDL